MSSSNDRPRPQKPIPRWLILVAVAVTGGTTVWAMSQTSLRGPQASWGQAQGAVEQVWAEPGMGVDPAGPQTAPMAAPMGAPMAVEPDMSGGARPVAGLPGVPMIMFGARRPHSDRGACTLCHGVTTGEGTPVPSIFSFSSMPHGFRGNCTNCHQITVGRGLTGSPVAATMVVPPEAAMVAAPMVAQMPQQMVPQQMVPQQMTQPMLGRPRNEAEWRGMEVRPGAQGLVVTNADGTAARSGLQPGDLVTSINGTSIADVASFIGATQNGNLPQGTVIVRRGDQRLAFELQPRVGDGAPANNAGAMTGPMAVN